MQKKRRPEPKKGGAFSLSTRETECIGISLKGKGQERLEESKRVRGIIQGKKKLILTDFVFGPVHGAKKSCFNCAKAREENPEVKIRGKKKNNKTKGEWAKRRIEGEKRKSESKKAFKRWGRSSKNGNCAAGTHKPLDFGKGQRE